MSESNGTEPSVTAACNRLCQRRTHRIFCFILDYGVHRACNLACRYCRPGSMPTGRASASGLAISVAGLDVVAAYVDAVMFKASGWGEITIVPGYVRLFEHAETLGYRVFQLITNGVRFPTAQDLAALRGLGYFSLQVSLDGIDRAANLHRFWRSQQLFERVKANLEHAVSERIPIEVNSVLTSINIADFDLFLGYLRDLSDKSNTRILCMPRPVQLDRAEQQLVKAPDGPAISEFEEKILRNYDSYQPVLPPLRYLEGLVTYLRTQQRSWTAFDTTSRICIGEKGNLVLPGSSDALGSIFSTDHPQIFAKRAAGHRVTGDDFGPKLTQFEVHSLYIGGQISWEEMASIPSCDNPIARLRLQRLRTLAADA